MSSIETTVTGFQGADVICHKSGEHVSSERFLFATRVAVSVVIAAGLSLAFGWEKPTWSIFAVIYCALGNEGESFYKGLMRILATFMGGGLSLLFMAIFNDHRWAFAAAVVSWISLCTYMMQDNRRYYFWLVGGWLTILMPIYSAERPAVAFETVMLRLEETILGVLVYTIVANVLLTGHQRRNFIHELRDQVENLKRVLVHLGAACHGSAANTNGKNALDLHREARAIYTGFRNRIDAGIVESFDIVNNRDAWRHTIGEFAALVDKLNSFYADISAFSIKRSLISLPDIGPVLLEIERRLDQTVALLDGAQEVDLPREVVLPNVDPPGAAEDAFDHGTVLVSLEALADIDRHSAGLLLAVAEARGIIRRKQSRQSVNPALRTVIPDPEKIALTLRTAVIFWLAFSIYIFVPDFPNGAMVVLLSTIYGMFLAMKPTTYTPLVEATGSLTIVVAGIIYMVVMPKVSGFLGLGTLLFLYIFAGAFLLSKTELAPVRFVALGFSTMVFQITNNQVYSFLYIANLLIVYQVPFILLSLTRSAPVSFRPEAAFQRLLRRYMASFCYLVEDIRQGEQHRDGWWKKQLRAYHLGNLVRSPDKIATWVGAMPKAAMNEEEKKQGIALCQSLYDLATRMMDLSRLCGASHGFDTIEQVRPTLRAWLEALEKLAETFRDQPDALPAAEELTARLNGYLAQVRAEVRKSLDNGMAATRSSVDRTLPLRELSVYRSLSEALISAARQASALHWERIREPRF